MPDTIQRLQIAFFLNDREVRVTVPPDRTALEVIRGELGLTGTKETCSEGDCGACTVALGELADELLVYRAVNSCILPAARLHGRHVITVEGLAADGRLHVIQQQLLDHHAVQCGYCTPGIVMSLFCLFLQRPDPDEAAILEALEGNLCRCTGYVTIRAAARAVAGRLAAAGGEARGLILPAYAADMERRLRAFGEPLRATDSPNADGRPLAGYHVPASLWELWRTLARVGDPARTRFIHGGTDVMVAVNIKRDFPEHLVDLSRIPELHVLLREGDVLRIGAGLTFTDLMESTLVADHLPVLARAAARIGSRQVRNRGTLGGNIANASPIADGAVALLGLDARLVLASAGGERTLPLEQFYKGYKDTDRQPGEIIRAVEVPLTECTHQYLKSSKRPAVDCASVSSLCSARLEDGRVAMCRLAFGGVAVYPALARQTAAFLAGRALDAETVRAAADLAAAEFQTIGDVRGSAAYRRALIRHHVIHHLESLRGNAELCGRHP
ncbi:MAG: 2Fe-2S iron-sulfur cluster binding domain-containing protein [Acidobacteria bacterium]|nr:2Fe-2S iron-sulfur cluster binding domain-containing protein [Acidobacteriota bacterium]